MTSCSEIHGIFSMATSFPETWARTDVANTSLSRGLACACTRNVQCRCFAMPSANAKARQIANINRVFMPLDKGFDTNFATPKTFGLFSLLMTRRIILLLLLLLMAGNIFGQDITPTPTPARRRGWLSRILHPFSPEVVPHYKDPRLRGLALDLQITPQTVKLSEVRQLGVKVTLANLSKRPVSLDFTTNQQVEISLRNSAGDILTKWSDNHAIREKSARALINPQEHVEYNEMIATRDLTPNKVFVAEVFFPAYPELRVRQKFLAVP